MHKFFISEGHFSSFRKVWIKALLFIFLFSQITSSFVDKKTYIFPAFPRLIHKLYITYPQSVDNLWINSGIIPWYSIYCSHFSPEHAHFITFLKVDNYSEDIHNFILNCPSYISQVRTVRNISTCFWTGQFTAQNRWQLLIEKNFIIM